MNVMNAKVSQNKGDSIFNSIMSRNTNSKSSKFNNILSNKESDNLNTKENKKQKVSKEDNNLKKPNKEVSKAKDDHETEEKLEKDESKSTNKEIENLLMSLIQNTESPIQLEDIELSLEESKILKFIGENLELENLENLESEGLSSKLINGEDLSRILASENGDSLEKLKELIKMDSDLKVDSADEEVKSSDKSIIPIEQKDMEEKSSLNLASDKKANPIENEDGKETDIKVEKGSNEKRQTPEIKEEPKAEAKSSEGFRTDLNTEIRSRSNLILDQVVNNSPEVEVNEEDVIKQVADKIQFNIGEETSEIKLSLKPKILGDMIMNLQVTKGEVVAKVFVDNYKTKQIIEANLVALQEEIKDTGMEIKTFEVFVGSNTDYEQPNQQQSSFFGKNKQNKFKAGKEDINLISSNYEAGTMENNGASLLMDGQSMDLQA